MSDFPASSMSIAQAQKALQFKASYYSSVKRLHIWGEIRLKVDQLNIGGLVHDHMAREVAKSQCNVSPFAAVVVVKFLDPFFKEFHGHPCGFIVVVLKTIIWHLLPPKTPWPLCLSHIKYRPFLSACLIADECDSNAKFVWLFSWHLLQRYSSIWRSTVQVVNFMNFSAFILHTYNLNSPDWCCFSMSSEFLEIISASESESISRNSL